MSRELRLYGWRGRPLIGVALVALAAGFGQSGVVTALGSVASTYGHLRHGATFADQAGLSGTSLGVGLAVIRLASLGGLPLAGLADRVGRRRPLLIFCAVGLAFTIATAPSPAYWWFVIVFALGRPWLSASSGIATVVAAELTASEQRARAVALVAAGYAVGVGLTAVIHSLTGIGFRAIVALSLGPLVALLFIRRMVVEPDRFALELPSEYGRPMIGPVERPYRGRLIVVAVITFGIAVITGPANSLVFVYAQNVEHLTGAVTAAMVVLAGVTGLVGLLLGRWLADHVGRRPAVALAILGLCGFGLLTYSGTKVALVGGYILGVLAGGIFAPSGGALANELFPTSVRASVSGWYIAAGVLGATVGLLVFGAVADVGGVANHTGFAALVTFLPVLPLAALLLALPETRGRELEELWPEHAS